MLRHGTALLPSRERGALRSAPAAPTAPARDTRPLRPGRSGCGRGLSSFPTCPRPCLLGKAGQKQPSLWGGRRWGSAVYRRRGLKHFGGCLVWICAPLPTRLFPPPKVLRRVVLCSTLASLFWLHLCPWRPDRVLWVHLHQSKLLAQKPPFFLSTFPQPSYKDLSPERLNATFFSHQAQEWVCTGMAKGSHWFQKTEAAASSAGGRGSAPGFARGPFPSGSNKLC